MLLLKSPCLFSAAAFCLPDVLRLHQDLPEAVEGVHFLATLGSVWYYTVRKHDDQVREQNIQAATKDWLLSHGYPCPTQIHFCQSVLDKLITFYEQEKPGYARLLLIDDRWQKAVEAFRILDDHSSEAAQIATFLRDRLTILAFGAHTVPQIAGIHLVALPSWAQIERVVKGLMGSQ